MSKEKSIAEMSLSALRKEAVALRKRIEQAKRAAHFDAGVVAANLVLEKAAKRFRAALGRAQDVLAGNLPEQLGSVEFRIRELEAERKAPDPPVHIQRILRLCRRGTDYGPVDFKILWVSPSGRFFILTWLGHCFWASQMEPSKYSPAEHFLMDCNSLLGQSRVCGSAVLDKLKVEEAKGRLSKGRREAWIAHATALETREPLAEELDLEALEAE